jgi:Protein of unknown function (DUF1343)
MASSSSDNGGLGRGRTSLLGGLYLASSALLGLSLSLGACSRTGAPVAASARKTPAGGAGGGAAEASGSTSGTAADSVAVAPAAQSAPQLGLDVLAAEDFARLRGTRVALLTNDTARAADGTRSLDALAAAPGVSVVALFTPEHGQAANKDEAIARTRSAPSRSLAPCWTRARPPSSIISPCPFATA